MKLSIIIVNFNGKKLVSRLLDSIVKNTLNSYEVIIVDNGSDDSSVEYLNQFILSRNFKNIQIISLDKNYGPAYARNVGFDISTSEFLAFLDNDTIVEMNWDKDPIKIFKRNKKVGIIQCKLLLANNKDQIDYVGEYIGRNGFLIQRARAGDIDKGQFQKEVDILAAKSAGMFMRASSFKKVEKFDSDYFIYVEETDLGWRNWLAGFRVIYCPTSIVYHEFGTSSIILDKKTNNRNAKFHGTKNYIMTLIKNLSFKNLCLTLPLHVFLWIGMAWFVLLTKRDYRSFLWIHQGIIWNIINIKSTISKRVKIQKNRKISESDLMKIIRREVNFKYFLNKVIIPHKVGNAEGFIKTK